jgi:hypothetical protein
LRFVRFIQLSGWAWSTGSWERFRLADVKGEGDAAGRGEGAEAATATFEGWLRMP